LQDGTRRFCKPFAIVAGHEVVVVLDYVGRNLGETYDIGANNQSDVAATFYLHVADSLDNHHPMCAYVCASYACAHFGKPAHRNNVAEDCGME
jgi:hypothetical protein